MGASLIGHACERHVWLNWRWAMTPEFQGRILRLFDSGKREESRLLEELRAIGATVWDADENGNQWRVSACNGHFAGSLDGVAKGLPEAPASVAVLEFKTHNNRSFTDLVKNKVRTSKPQHFDQMTVYMGLMKIDRALYIAVNKDSDDLYVEWVHLDPDRFDMLIAKAERLIQMSGPPPRVSDDPAFFLCKMCGFWKHCHNGVAAEVNCRTCCHASPVANSAWHCGQRCANQTETTQRKGCGDHLLIPGLIPYAEPIDGGEGWVAYKHRKTGALFVNGPAGVNDYGPVFSSLELHQCPGQVLDFVADLKNEFSGSRVIDGDVTLFDDLATTPDSIPVRAQSKDERKTSGKNRAFAEALMAFDKK